MSSLYIIEVMNWGIIWLGEWWDANPIDVLRQATRTGAAPKVSDAYTINGQPGDLYRCSSKGKFQSMKHSRYDLNYINW